MPDPKLPRKPENADIDASPPPLVFVGGTGRSGTHVIAELLGKHSFYADVPIEARFHAKPQGFPDLLAGEVTLDQFLRKLEKFWWHRVAAGELLPAVLPRVPLGREVRGLHKVVPRERFDRAIPRFRRRFEKDPEAACRRLYIDLLWPISERRKKSGLVEMTTSTMQHANTLHRLFPEAKFVHIVRDGRDSGSSKVAQRQRSHHPRDAAEGFGWWLDRLERIERGHSEVPPERVLHLSLDELVAGDREGSYRALLEFLGLSDEPPMREYFEQEMNAENANRDRWREGLGEAEQRELTERYEQALDELESRGFASAPALRAAYERLG